MQREAHVLLDKAETGVERSCAVVGCSGPQRHVCQPAFSGPLRRCSDQCPCDSLTLCVGANHELADLSIQITGSVLGRADADEPDHLATGFGDQQDGVVTADSRNGFGDPAPDGGGPYSDLASPRGHTFGEPERQRL